MEPEDFFRDTKINMYLSWLLTISVLAVFVESLLDFDILWIIFSGITMMLILIPPIRYRNHMVMLPWEVLLIAAIPVIVRTFQFSPLANEIATYLALAAVALIISVELDAFTEVSFTHGFAIGFTVITTLALAGIWAILRYQMDMVLGTSFLTTNEELMHEFFNALVAGVFAGALFDGYFRRRDRYLRKAMRKEGFR